MEKKLFDIKESSPESEEEVIEFKNFLLSLKPKDSPRQNPASNRFRFKVSVPERITKPNARKKLMKKIIHPINPEKENPVMYSETQPTESPVIDTSVTDAPTEQAQVLDFPYEVEQSDYHEEQQEHDDRSAEEDAVHQIVDVQADSPDEQESFEEEPHEPIAEGTPEIIQEEPHSEIPPHPNQRKDRIMATNAVQELRAKILEEKKTTSLPKLAVLCKINYFTILAIANGTSQRLTSRVENNLREYFAKKHPAASSAPAKKAPVVPTTVPTTQPTIPPLKFYFADSLPAEISATRARLKYLETIEEAEKAYLKALSQKPF